MPERLVARGAFRYAGKFLKAGESFNALSANDALVLKATKKARPAPESETERRAKRARMPQWPPVPAPPAPLVPEPQPVEQPPAPPPQEATQAEESTPAPEQQPAEEPMPQAEPEPEAEPTSVDNELVMQGLRERAEALGITVDGRWSTRRLRAAIAEAGTSSRYSRRDLRPEE